MSSPSHARETGSAIVSANTTPVLLALLFLLFLCQAALPQSQRKGYNPCEDKVLCIGVRGKAAPFSYLASDSSGTYSDWSRGPLVARHYGGYMVELCDAVLLDMIAKKQIPKEDVGIFDFDEYRENISGDNSRSRFELLGDRIDILCDPATITGDRRLDFIVSPPLFLTGIGFVSTRTKGRFKCEQNSRPGQNEEEALIGLVGGTTAADRGLLAIIQAGEIPEFRDEVIMHLQKPNSCKGLVKSFDTHAQAAKAFCERKVSYYVGDLEIILAHVRQIAACEYDNGAQTYTNDRYAVFGKPGRAGDATQVERRAKLISAFFEILTEKVVFNPSILDKAYYNTFFNAPKSKKLEVFYWSIRGEPG